MSQFGKMPTNLNQQNRPREIDWRVFKEYIPLFDEGKDIEVRVRKGFPERVRENDVLIINGGLVKRRVKKIWRHFTSFADMLDELDARRIHPRMNRVEVLDLLRKMYPPEKEALGVLVFELVPAEAPQSHGQGEGRKVLSDSTRRNVRTDRPKSSRAHPTPTDFTNNLGEAMKRALEKGKKE